MTKLADIRHPYYSNNIANWSKYRLVYEGGDTFIRAYLRQYSKFEAKPDYEDRLAVTYNPGTAASAVDVVKNALFQRLTDVLRNGGGKTYQEAIKTGVDIANRNMNCFIGDCVLPELLSMGRVFVHIDAPLLPEQASLADTKDEHPYLYIYQTEDVLSWSTDMEGYFNSILIRNRVETLDPTYGLTANCVCQYKLYRKIQGIVSVETYNADSEKIGDTLLLDIPEIPIIAVEIKYSLLKDVANYQISALQLASSDINFLFKSGFPLYTEQFDPRFRNALRGPANPGGSGTAAQASDSVAGRATRALEQNPPVDEGAPTVFTGAGKGRAYPLGTERPGYIAPQSEPIKTSMLKQEVMAKEVRELVNLTLSSMATSYASGTSKAMDQAGLEAGLSYIGMVLAYCENEIARIWALYTNESVAIIKYPNTYSLKTEEQRLNEAKEYKSIQGAVPSRDYSRNISKKIAHTLLSGLVDQTVLEEIYDQIEKAPGVSGDVEQIASDLESGIVSTETACTLRGYDPGEAVKAAEDHAKRIARIMQAQSKPGGTSDMNDPREMKDQKKATMDDTMDDTPGKNQRGKGK